MGNELAGFHSSSWLAQSPNFKKNKLFVIFTAFGYYDGDYDKGGYQQWEKTSTSRFFLSAMQLGIDKYDIILAF